MCPGVWDVDRAGAHTCWEAAGHTGRAHPWAHSGEVQAPAARIPAAVESRGWISSPWCCGHGSTERLVKVGLKEENKIKP